MKFILGKKIGMTQIFDKNGKQIPVTLIEAGPCEVLRIKTKEKDGYEAVQIGFQKIEKEKNIKKPQRKKPYRYLKEFKAKEMNISYFKEGQIIDVSIFREGEKVKIAGISKGKGFAGVVKRWGFAGRPITHGTKHEIRAPGSIGAATPPRVVKGRKMAGKTGVERITVKNLEIVKVDKDNNLLAIKGAVPGSKHGLLEIQT